MFSFDWCKKKKYYFDKDLVFFVKFYKGKDFVIEIVKRFLYGVYKCNVWYLFDKYIRMMNNLGWSFVRGGGCEKFEGNLWRFMIKLKFGNMCINKFVVFIVFLWFLIFF